MATSWREHDDGCEPLVGSVTYWTYLYTEEGQENVMCDNHTSMDDLWAIETFNKWVTEYKMGTRYSRRANDFFACITMSNPRVCFYSFCNTLDEGSFGFWDEWDRKEEWWPSLDPDPKKKFNLLNYSS